MRSGRALAGMSPVRIPSIRSVPKSTLGGVQNPARRAESRRAG